MGDPKVFGIGLSRTGTRSLTFALNQLGIRVEHFPCDPTILTELMSGQFELTILKTYDGLSDTPVVPYYSDFDRIYPGSKFILTVREKQSWLSSVEEHWKAFEFVGPELPEAPFWKHYSSFVHSCVYGCHGFNRDRFSHVYDVHEDNVKRYFHNRPGSLLVMDICAGEGWETLCPFLGLDVPLQPFPAISAFAPPSPA